MPAALWIEITKNCSGDSKFGVRYQWEGADLNHVLILTGCMMHCVCLFACGPAVSEVGEMRAWQV